MRFVNVDSYFVCLFVCLFVHLVCLFVWLFVVFFSKFQRCFFCVFSFFSHYLHPLLAPGHAMGGSTVPQNLVEWCWVDECPAWTKFHQDENGMTIIDVLLFFFFFLEVLRMCSVFLSFFNDEMQLFWRLFWTLKIENKSSYHRVWCGELPCPVAVSDPCGAKNCGVDIETWTTGSLHSQWGSCFLIPWNLRLKVWLNLLQHLSIR